MHWSSIIFFYILKNFYRCTSCLLAHHLTYIVVYIVFLLFEKIAHYILVLYARFLRENARTALITKTVWWMLNEWEILQCKLILRKKNSERRCLNNKWRWSSTHSYHCKVSKTRKNLDPSWFTDWKIVKWILTNRFLQQYQIP